MITWSPASCCRTPIGCGSASSSPAPATPRRCGASITTSRASDLLDGSGIGSPSSIAEALKIQTTAAERERLFRRYTENSAAAYELYLRGRAQLPRYTPDALRAAIAAFERALAIDPDNAPARAGIALASAIMRLRFAPQSEASMWTERAEREARAALRSDSQLAEAHEALAAVYRAVEFDWERTIEESGLALALNPNLDQPHFYRAAAFYHLGLFDLADAAVRAGFATNPANRLDTARTAGSAAILAARFQEAVPWLKKCGNSSAIPRSISFWGRRISTRVRQHEPRRCCARPLEPPPAIGARAHFWPASWRRSIVSARQKHSSTLSAGRRLITTSQTISRPHMHSFGSRGGDEMAGRSRPDRLAVLSVARTRSAARSAQERCAVSAVPG